MRFKNKVMAIVLLCAFLCCSGCGTTKGVLEGLTQGLTEDTQAAVKGTGIGAKAVGNAIVKSDQWFKENLW